MLTGVSTSMAPPAFSLDAPKTVPCVFFVSPRSFGPFFLSELCSGPGVDGSHKNEPNIAAATKSCKK